MTEFSFLCKLCSAMYINVTVKVMRIQYLWLGADNADRDSSASRKLDDDAEINPTAETESDPDDLIIIIISLVITLIIIAVIVSGVVIYCRRRTKVVGMSFSL